MLKSPTRPNTLSGLSQPLVKCQAPITVTVPVYILQGPSLWTWRALFFHPPHHLLHGTSAPAGAKGRGGTCLARPLALSPPTTGSMSTPPVCKEGCQVEDTGGLDAENGSFYGEVTAQKRPVESVKCKSVLSVVSLIPETSQPHVDKVIHPTTFAFMAHSFMLRPVLPLEGGVSSCKGTIHKKGRALSTKVASLTPASQKEQYLKGSRDQLHQLSPPQLLPSACQEQTNTTKIKTSLQEQRNKSIC